MSEWKEITEYPWFLPKPTLVQEQLNNLVARHQEDLKPFGLKTVATCAFFKIWPGSTPEEISGMHRHVRASVYHMIIDNLLGIIREIAVSTHRMPNLNSNAREMAGQVKSAARESAIQVAGLTVKATLALPVIKDSSGEKNSSAIDQEISELDIVEKAVEDAVESLGWYVSWMTVEDHFRQKNYGNPFAPLVELWKLGVWPMGVSQDQYVVLVPGGRRVRIVAPSLR